MENTDSVIIYRIIHNFKRVAGTVKRGTFALRARLRFKPNNRVLFRQLAKRGIANSVPVGAQNILFLNLMPKRRFVEFNDNIHGVNIA